MTFDKDRLIIHKKTRFKPFQVSSFIPAKIILEESIVSILDGILIFEHQGKAYGLMTKQMTYHHVANGAIDGEPYMISF